MRRRFLSTAEVSTETGVPQETLRYWRYCGTGPRSFKLGRRVVYSEDDLTEWIEQQRRKGQPGGDAA
jgi:predicted DNA-binding transcriptional regulator AlpA